MSQNVKVNVDVYKGVHVYIIDMNINQMAQYLNKIQISNLYRTVWVYLKANHCLHLDYCLNTLNFKIHNGKGKQITVYKRLVKGQDKTVPYTMFCVAAGALVIKNGCVLLVQEKGGARKGKFGLPGGRADAGQTIAQCAARQLYQQTKLKGKMKRIVYFRQLTKNQNYGCVDLYFICLMQLLEQTNIQICQKEISSFQWVPLQEYSSFCKQKSIGTQLLVSQYVEKLYRQKTLFNNKEDQFIFDMDKGLSQHRL